MKKFLFLLLFPLQLFAQKNYSQLLDEYVKAHQDVKHFSGAVLVAKQNKILLNKGYGIEGDKKFLIASLTKQFTAAAILQLEEKGKLKLDDKLGKYLPGFPKADSITIEMLLNHTSGMADYTSITGFNNFSKQSWPKDSVISFFRNRPFAFSPGTKAQENNSGYYLLGYIIEKVSGQSYENYLRKNIFQKAGMESSGVYDDKGSSEIAPGNIKTSSGLVAADKISSAWMYSAGGIYSTVSDLYKWDRALNGTSVLSPGSKNKMFTPGKGDYGYGVRIDTLYQHPVAFASGGLPGYLAIYQRFEKDDICILVLSNTQIAMSNTLPVTTIVADGLSAILFDQHYEAPYIHKEITIDPSLLDRYVGKYRAGLTLEVIKKDNKLYRHREGSPDIELKPESETKFFYADDSDRQLEFEVDKTGKVTKIWFINAGQRGEMTKSSQ